MHILRVKNKRLFLSRSESGLPYYSTTVNSWKVYFIESLHFCSTNMDTLPNFLKTNQKKAERFLVTSFLLHVKLNIKQNNLLDKTNLSICYYLTLMEMLRLTITRLIHTF